ncbi:hypothetical protein ACIQUG_33355 [Ensifer sp. NPDC090286]|uniref:hypothetical protein n=1 Tax=Ensifer sp. NPDC090286 TaxID=3363991 RepID=UPI00383AE89A
MPNHDQLDQAIYIHLTTTPAPAKRALAGTGQSRKRERPSAHRIATTIVKAIRKNHRIERHGVTVPESEIIDLLAEELWNVPEAIAKHLVGVDATKRDDAKQVITSALLSALTTRYECTFVRSGGASGLGPQTQQ